MKKYLLMTLFVSGTPIIVYAGNLADSFANNSVPVDVYVYGGFEIVEQAFLMCSLIISDPKMTSLIYTSVLLGSFLGFISSAVSGATGKPTLGSFMLKASIYMVLYMTLLYPTRPVQIRDLHYNKAGIINGVPWAVAMGLGILTQLESDIIDILDTTSIGAADSYKRGGGGLGFSVLENITKKNYVNADPVFAQNLDTYVEECVMFELLRPGGDIQADDLMRNEDIMDVIDKAAAPGVSMPWLTATGSESLITCQQGWTSLSAILNSPATWLQPSKEACSNSGMDMSSATGQNQCQGIINEYVALALGPGLTSTPSAQHFMMQSTVNNAIKDAILEGGDNASLYSANQGIMNKGISAGIMTNEWMPVARAVMTALAIILTPFIVVLAPTPKGGEALTTMFGFYLFLTIWGIIDASIHYFMQAMAEVFFWEVRNYQLGLTAIMTTPTETAKVISMYGALRTMGVMLAGIFAKIVGGHTAGMMSSAAGSIARSGQQAGEQVGSLQTSDGGGMKMKSMVQGDSLSLMANSGRFSYDNMVRSNVGEHSTKIASGIAQYDRLDDSIRAAQFGATSSILTANEQINQLGGLGGRSAAENMAHINAGSAKRAAAGASLRGDGDVQALTQATANADGFNDHKKVGAYQTDVAFGKALGIQAGDIGKMDAAHGGLTSEMASKMRDNGYSWAQEGMKLSGNKENMSGMMTIENQKDLENAKAWATANGKNENFADNLKVGDTLRFQGATHDSVQGNTKFSVDRGGETSEMDKTTWDQTQNVRAGDKRDAHSQKTLMEEQAFAQVGEYYVNTDGTLNKTNSREMNKQMAQDINAFFDQTFQTDASGKIIGDINGKAGVPGVASMLSGIEASVGISWKEMAGMSRDQRSNVVTANLEANTRDNYLQAKKDLKEYRADAVDSGGNLSPQDEVVYLQQRMGQLESEDKLSMTEGYAQTAMSNTDRTVGLADATRKGMEYIADKAPDVAQQVLDDNNPMKNREKVMRASRQMNWENDPESRKGF
jgi:hypothetical protein